MKQTPTNEPRKIAGVIIALVLVTIAVIWSILQGYAAPWTGFGDFTTSNGEFVRGKTLWDWMELLVIPLVLAIGAFYLNRSERAVERQIAEERAKLEREIATDRQQETALQAYLDRIADLLLKENLRVSENEELRNVAKIRTLATLRGLDANRKRLVLLFLYESGLVGEQPVIYLTRADLTRVNLLRANLAGASLMGANLMKASLIGADLSKADLSRANLSDADMTGADLIRTSLRKANLTKADLTGANLLGASLRNADLKEANLTGVNLSEADLREANLTGANLTGTNLKGARVSDEQLATVESLTDTTMPDVIIQHKSPLDEYE